MGIGWHLRRKGRKMMGEGGGSLFVQLLGRKVTFHEHWYE